MLLNRQASLPHLSVPKQETLIVQDSPFSTPTVDLGEFFHLILKNCDQTNESNNPGKTAGSDSDVTGVDNNVSSLVDVLQAEDNCNDTTAHIKGDIDDTVQSEKSDLDKDMSAAVNGNMNIYECVKCIESKVNWEKLNMDTAKNYKKRKSRVQGTKKKWKVCSLSVGFEYSLLPWRAPVCDSDYAADMEKELKAFQKDCKTEDQGLVETDISPGDAEKGSDSISDTGAVEENLVDKEHKRDHKSLVRLKSKATETFKSKHTSRLYRDRSYDYEFESTYFDWVLFYESKMDAHKLEGLVIVQEEKRIRHIRSKKKYKETKAHKQVKSKHCHSIHNGGYGKKLYIKHIIMAAIHQRLGQLYRGKTGLSIKRIDKEKGYPRKEIKAMVSCITTSVPATHKPVAKVQRNHEKALGHTLDAYNFDDGFATDLVNALQSVQYRDLTPEDYELLLRLDERVKPKTIDSSELDKLKTDKVTEDNAGDICMVCLDPYIIGEVRKLLPCDHVFHASCIEMWLKNNSVTCPLDGTEVLPS